MNAIGTVFVSKFKPVVNTDATGRFVLTMTVIDRLGPHSTEPWRLFWQGDEARAFWQAHQMSLTAGQALCVTVERIRPHTVATFKHGAFTEIHAHIQSCALATPMALAA